MELHEWSLCLAWRINVISGRDFRAEKALSLFFPLLVCSQHDLVCGCTYVQDDEMCIEHDETVIFTQTSCFYRVLLFLSPCHLFCVRWALAFIIRSCSPHFHNPGERRLVTEQGVIQEPETKDNTRTEAANASKTQDDRTRKQTRNTGWCEEGRKNLNTQGLKFNVGKKTKTWSGTQNLTHKDVIYKTWQE